jgi:glutamate synthase domain-containing protein 2
MSYGSISQEAHENLACYEQNWKSNSAKEEKIQNVSKKKLMEIQK